MNAGIKNYGFAAFLGVLFTVIFSDAALAQTQVDDVARNIVTSNELLPGILTGASYLLGLLLGILGVFKLKDHVDNPTQTPLRVGLIRLIAGGALFALPIVFEAMRNTLDGGAVSTFDPGGTAGGAIGALLGAIGSIPLLNFNNILINISDSIDELPGIITAAAYLLGLLLGVIGILKLKDHVENPEQTPLREGIIRIIIGGALFTIPTIYEAMFNTIEGGGSIFGAISGLFAGAGFFFSGYAQNVCVPAGPLSTSLGEDICSLILHTGAFPAFLTSIAYLIGLVLGFWGLLKIRDHVLNPQQTSIWEGVSRLLAGGAFFALPAIIEVARQTLGATALAGMTLIPITPIGYNETPPLACDGLDGALYCFMDDLLAPMHVVINFFAFVAGTILIMIGISRLIKSAQDGPRGPGGFGTIMTFLAGGALISSNELMRAFSTSLFSNPMTRTFATLEYTTGMSAAEVAHAHTVISAVLKFLIVVGLISFVRGIFIIRSVAEGNQQASLMAGVTHMVGGALAVNLGPLMNSVQSTLGITTFGITFT